MHNLRRPPISRLLCRSCGCTVVALVAAALLLTACGGSSTTANSSSSQSTAAPSADSPPGVQAFGLTDEEFATAVEDTESLIAQCMTEAGFEYVPLDVTTVLSVSEWLRTEPGVSRFDYKSEWGFAASTRFDDPAVEVSRGEQNIRIFDDLSEADQVAYERTLYGEGADATFGIGLDDEDFSGTGGCTRDAVDAMFEPDQVSGEFVNPKDILVESDPRVVAANEQWRNCMLTDGYDYPEQDAIIEDYEERLDALLDGAEPDELNSVKQDQLASLQAEEITVALKDLECQEPVDIVIREVEIEIFGFAVS